MFVIVDVDNFKVFNDFYGYEVGDVVFKNIVEVFVFIVCL